MDGKQFLKEAKEAYSENYDVNFANFTVDEFKRSIYHYKVLRFQYIFAGKKTSLRKHKLLFIHSFRDSLQGTSG